MDYKAILETLKKELLSELDAFNDPWHGSSSDESEGEKYQIKSTLERIKELEIQYAKTP